MILAGIGGIISNPKISKMYKMSQKLSESQNSDHQKIINIKILNNFESIRKEKNTQCSILHIYY